MRENVCDDTLNVIEMVVGHWVSRERGKPVLRWLAVQIQISERWLLSGMIWNAIQFTLRLIVRPVVHAGQAAARDRSASSDLQRRQARSHRQFSETVACRTSREKDRLVLSQAAGKEGCLRRRETKDRTVAQQGSVHLTLRPVQNHSDLALHLRFVAPKPRRGGGGGAVSRVGGRGLPELPGPLSTTVLALTSSVIEVA